MAFARTGIAAAFCLVALAAAADEPAVTAPAPGIVEGTAPGAASGPIIVGGGVIADGKLIIGFDEAGKAMGWDNGNALTGEGIVLPENVTFPVVASDLTQVFSAMSTGGGHVVGNGLVVDLKGMTLALGGFGGSGRGDNPGNALAGNDSVGPRLVLQLLPGDSGGILSTDAEPDAETIAASDGAAGPIIVGRGLFADGKLVIGFGELAKAMGWENGNALMGDGVALPDNVTFPVVASDLEGLLTAMSTEGGHVVGNCLVVDLDGMTLALGGSIGASGGGDNPGNALAGNDSIGPKLVLRVLEGGSAGGRGGGD